MIHLKQLNKHYTQHGETLNVLQDIHLDVATSNIAGIVGKSGAGKSTLLRCMNGLERADSGQIIIAGTDLMQLTPKQCRSQRRRIGMIFQHFNLLDSRSVYDNIALPLQLAGDTQKTETQAKIKQLLALTGLQQRQHAYPAQLSGGEKQRVAIARALVNQPSLLLADEPTSALDPETTAAILTLLQTLQRELALTIVIISHAMAVIKQICDEVTVLEQGHVIEQGRVLDIFKHPSHPVTQNLVRQQLSSQLPTDLLIHNDASADHAPLWRIWLTGHHCQIPQIATMMQQHQVRMNILHANIERLQHESLGMMLASLHGSPDQIAASRAYLETQGHIIENLGYVAD